MSEKRPHLIPHPLCQSEGLKYQGTDVNIREGLENLDAYVRDSCNPPWAASHLIRSVANGLSASGNRAAAALRSIASYLGSANSTPGSFEACTQGTAMPSRKTEPYWAPGSPVWESWRKHFNLTPEEATARWGVQ